VCGEAGVRDAPFQLPVVDRASACKPANSLRPDCNSGILCVCACVCVCERERERVNIFHLDCNSGILLVCVCVRACVWCVCMYVLVRACMCVYVSAN